MTDRSEPTRPRVFWASAVNRVVVLADRRIDNDPWLRLPGVSTMLSDADGGPGAIPASTVELVPAENLDERKRHTEACEGVNMVIHDMGLGGEFAPIDPDDPTDLADVVLNLCQGMLAARRERDEARRERDVVMGERDRFQTSAQAAGTESLELASKLSDLRTRLGELARDA